MTFAETLSLRRSHSQVLAVRTSMYLLGTQSHPRQHPEPVLASPTLQGGHRLRGSGPAPAPRAAPSLPGDPQLGSDAAK